MSNICDKCTLKKWFLENWEIKMLSGGNDLHHNHSKMYENMQQKHTPVHNKPHYDVSHSCEVEDEFSLEVQKNFWSSFELQSRSEVSPKDNSILSSLWLISVILSTRTWITMHYITMLLTVGRASLLLFCQLHYSTVYCSYFLGPESEPESRCFGARVEVGVQSAKYSNPGVGVPQKIRTPHPCFELYILHLQNSRHKQNT